MSTIRRAALIALACAAALLALTPAAGAATGHKHGRHTRSSRHNAGAPGQASSSVALSNRFSPEVIRTDRPPTGYAVRFRFWDPSATSVQIKGEWYFSNPAQTTTATSQGLLPFQWSPGDVPSPIRTRTRPTGRLAQ
jgi:hypothetical protein